MHQQMKNFSKFRWLVQPKQRNPTLELIFFLPLSVQVDWLIDVNTAFTDTNGRMLAHKRFLLLGDIELDTVINQYVLKCKA